MIFAQMLQAILQHSGTQKPTGQQTLPSNLIENLDNIGAFRGRPAYRYIMAAMQRTQLIEKLNDQISTVNEKRTLIERFITHTGFQPRLVYALTEALSSALGLTDYPTIEQSTPHHAHPHSLTTKDTLTHLNTLFLINRETEPFRGITIINPTITEIIHPTQTTPGGIKLTVTLKRTKNSGSASLHYAVYTANTTSPTPNKSENTSTDKNPTTPTPNTSNPPPHIDSIATVTTPPTAPSIGTVHPSDSNAIPTPIDKTIDFSHLTLLTTGIADTITIQTPTPHPISTIIKCNPHTISLILLYLD